MRATTALSVTTCTKCVLLTRACGSGLHQCWHCAVGSRGLTIRTWLGDGQSWEPPDCVTQLLAPQDCLDCDPVQEMWRRATEKIERQGYSWRTGN